MTTTDIATIDKHHHHYTRVLAQVPEVVRLHNSGNSIRDIVTITGFSNNTIRAILRDINIGVDHKGYTSKTLRTLLSCCKEAKHSFKETYYDGIVKDKPDHLADYYFDVLFSDDFFTMDGINTLLDKWITALEQLDDSAHSRGASIALIMLKDYLTYIKEAEPPEEPIVLPTTNTGVATTPKPQPTTKEAKETIVSTKPQNTEVAKPIAKEIIKPPTLEYPKPWCTVKNMKGEIIRYEDKNGQPIPKELWNNQG